MRSDLPVLAVFLLIGAGLFSLFVFAGLGGFIAGAVAFAVCMAIGVIVCLFIRAGTGPMNDPKDLVKQIAIWLSIVSLFPLAVWYGGELVYPSPNYRDYQKKKAELAVRNAEAAKEEKQAIREELDRLETEHEEEFRSYNEWMFWVAYPAGLAGVVIGLFFPVQAVGAGLMFGGLIALTAGCYSYWDEMGVLLRFLSLAVALAVVLVLGTWSFWPARKD